MIVHFQISQDLCHRHIGMALEDIESGLEDGDAKGALKRILYNIPESNFVL